MPTGISQAAKPFNHKLKFVSTDVAAWEMSSLTWAITFRQFCPHRSMQFHETVSAFANTGLLR